MKVYNAYHLNIMYSSISTKMRKDVIKKCYWPLLKLAELGIPISLESSGLTLEIINGIDPEWIKKFKNLINNKNIELIGSGYSQLIGPLVPSKVNDWNQKLGIEVYKKLIGVQPDIALVNEMAFSGGIIDHYINNGYKGIIMEWNNPRCFHPEWENEWRFYPQLLKSSKGKLISNIWSDSIAFQKFQRYVYNDITLEEYSQYLKSNSSSKDRFFPLYTNDVEIFDFRPGRYKTEQKISKESEWERIYRLYLYLKDKSWCEYVFTSSLLDFKDKPFSNNLLKLESSEHPIPVKKQPKYNVNRWGLTGRDDVKINTACFKFYQELIKIDDVSNDKWRELCYLWSSDFRTHINKERWNNFLKKIKKYELQPSLSKKPKFKNNNLVTDKFIKFSNESFFLELNSRKGCSFNRVIFHNLDSNPLLGTVNHGFYDDIFLAADFFSNNALIAQLGESKITDLNINDIFIDSANGKVYTYLDDEEVYIKTEIMLEDDFILINKYINLNEIKKGVIRPLHYTFMPESWDVDSLYVMTHNGGRNLETFFLKNQPITHNEIYSEIISSTQAFGNTEGIFIVGDKDKSICFENEMKSCALLPSLVFKKTYGTFFLRLVFSCGEVDETIKTLRNRQFNIKMKIYPWEKK